MAWVKHKNGFTIVELLIVVVVIAILAVITIVAYNGIQNRAKDSAMQAAVVQAAKKLLSHAVINNDSFPTEAEFATPSFRSSTLGLPNDTDQATYNYNVSDDRKLFCVSIANTTVSPVSAYASTQSKQSIVGRCVKNLILNPSIETNTTNCAVSPGTGGTITTSRYTGGATSGTASHRAIWTVGTTSEVVAQCYAPVEAGKTYSGRVDARPSWSGAQMRLQFAWVSTPSAWNSTPSTSATQNSWSSRTLTATAPATATGVYVQASFQAGTKPTANDILDADSFMLVEGSTVPSFMDGNSANWSWVGAQNNSASFGPVTTQ